MKSSMGYLSMLMAMKERLSEWSKNSVRLLRENRYFTHLFLVNCWIKYHWKNTGNFVCTYLGRNFSIPVRKFIKELSFLWSHALITSAIDAREVNRHENFIERDINRANKKSWQKYREFRDNFARTVLTTASVGARAERNQKRSTYIPLVEFELKSVWTAYRFMIDLRDSPGGTRRLGISKRGMRSRQIGGEFCSSDRLLLRACQWPETHWTVSFDVTKEQYVSIYSRHRDGNAMKMCFQYAYGWNVFYQYMLGICSKKGESPVDRQKAWAWAVLIFLSLWLPQTASLSILWGDMNMIINCLSTNMSMAMAIIKMLTLQYQRRGKILSRSSVAGCRSWSAFENMVFIILLFFIISSKLLARFWLRSPSTGRRLTRAKKHGRWMRQLKSVDSFQLFRCLSL